MLGITNVKFYHVITPNIIVVPDLLVTRAIMDQGTFVNVTPTYLTGQEAGTDGFTI